MQESIIHPKCFRYFCFFAWFVQFSSFLRRILNCITHKTTPITLKRINGATAAVCSHVIGANYYSNMFETEPNGTKRQIAGNYQWKFNLLMYPEAVSLEQWISERWRQNAQCSVLHFFWDGWVRESSGCWMLNTCILDLYSPQFHIFKLKYHKTSLDFANLFGRLHLQQKKAHTMTNLFEWLWVQPNNYAWR